MVYVMPGSSESILPSTITAYGGANCSALAVSRDGMTIATATDDYVNIYPVSSLWLPCISYNIPIHIKDNNIELQSKICKHSNCIYKEKLKPYERTVNQKKRERRQNSKQRSQTEGTIQNLYFFGEDNRHLIAIGPSMFLVYDLMTMDLDPIISFDMRYFGLDSEMEVGKSGTFLVSLTVLNIDRKIVHSDQYEKPLSSIDFVLSVKPYIPTYYRILFDEDNNWWIVDCPYTVGIIPEESLDDDVPYLLFNHARSQYPKNTLCSLVSDPCVIVDLEDSKYTSGITPTSSSNLSINSCIPSNSTKCAIGGNKSSVSSSSADDENLQEGDTEIPISNEKNDYKDEPAGEDKIPEYINGNNQSYVCQIPSFGTLSKKTKDVKPKKNIIADTKSGTYYPFCLLEQKVNYTDKEILEHAKYIGEEDIVIYYNQQFLFSTSIPISTIIMLKFTLCNFFLVKWKDSKPYIELKWIGNTDSTIISDILLTNVGIKVHTFLSRGYGKLFTIIASDRFFLLKYTSSSPVSANLKRCNNTMLNGNSVKMHILNIVENDEESTIALQYTHYDPVLRLRYCTASFSNDETGGYLVICTNFTTQWGLQFFNLVSQSGVDAIRLILDISKCKGFTHILWPPNHNKLIVISKINGELYQLEPKTKRNWVGLIPNFSAIDKNIEVIEEEDIFDSVKTSKPAQDLTRVEKVPKKKRIEKTNYPFYHLGFSLIGDNWNNLDFYLDIQGQKPTIHADTSENKLTYTNKIKCALENFK
ncbi:hypothetical protein BEWA_053210 [Theileria equi strain WA]|uniref:Uncharacterized protein n=1 Tax=Theileria equi strain WA TaxID=1537102 RepID=L1LD65_THEEQ|nr:hypothetical protein BEWA_053210 [Theileria equi strain WA]EKX73266.1 hypothetical protein BEWA_053210 [Theileria equi strain WA]|eukprot:XP_004832718.1 hypothetical protein BEWA_053210 [Theileria equi strain WA]